MRFLTSLLLMSLVVLFLARCDDQVVAPDAAVEENAVGDAENAVSKNGPPTSATMIFGRDVGSPFPPQEGHDGSTHAKDSMVPRTVVIARGGEVTFRIGPVHRVAIYEPGTRPDDIDTDLLVDVIIPFPPFVVEDFVVDDPNGRVEVSWPDPSELRFEPVEWSFTFTEPGRYLIICTTAPHFIDNDMYGWVIVR